MALAVALLSGCATASVATAPAPEVVRFSLPDLDGKTVEPADFAGRVVLVDIWATWCTPCEASFPFYADLQRELGDKGLTIVAISVDESVDDVRAFLEGRDLPFIILHDPAGAFPEKMNIQKMPTAYLIGRDGDLISTHAGFVPADEDGIRAQVEAALAGAAAK